MLSHRPWKNVVRGGGIVEPSEADECLCSNTRRRIAERIDKRFQIETFRLSVYPGIDLFVNH